jgi:hypothetical protein
MIAAAILQGAHPVTLPGSNPAGGLLILGGPKKTLREAKAVAEDDSTSVL